LTPPYSICFSKSFPFPIFPSTCTKELKGEENLIPPYSILLLKNKSFPSTSRKELEGE
jgi:hypothetical protein